VKLLQVINRLEEDQEISSVLVVDQRKEIRYNIDPEKVGTTSKDPLLNTALDSGDASVTSYTNSGGKALALVTPLKVQGMAKPIGALRIDLTFRRIDQQVTATRKRYFIFILLGSLVTCAGIILAYSKLWVETPLLTLKAAIQRVNPLLPEATVPETGDEFGQLSAAINELINRFRSESQQLVQHQKARGEQEREWTRQLLQAFLPQARLLLADRDNRVISDSVGAAPVKGRQRPHLLDLIRDTNFGNLLNEAFQQEGNVVRGPVMFQETTYEASILSVPLQQATTIKTLIALQPK
jgi:HAMP domain-containing protein